MEALCAAKTHPRLSTWETGHYYFRHPFTLGRAAMSENEIPVLRQDSLTCLCAQPGAALSWEGRRGTRGEPAVGQLPTGACAALPACSAAAMQLRDDDRQMFVVLSAVKRESTTEKGSEQSV